MACNWHYIAAQLDTLPDLFVLDPPTSSCWIHPYELVCWRSKRSFWHGGLDLFSHHGRMVCTFSLRDSCSAGCHDHAPGRKGEGDAAPWLSAFCYAANTFTRSPPWDELCHTPPRQLNKR